MDPHPAACTVPVLISAPTGHAPDGAARRGTDPSSSRAGWSPAQV